MYAVNRVAYRVDPYAGVLPSDKYIGLDGIPLDRFLVRFRRPPDRRNLRAILRSGQSRRRRAWLRRRDRVGTPLAPELGFLDVRHPAAMAVLALVNVLIVSRTLGAAAEPSSS